MDKTIIVQVSPDFFERLFAQGIVIDPYEVKVGLPADAVFVGSSYDNYSHAVKLFFNTTSPDFEHGQTLYIETECLGEQDA